MNSFIFTTTSYTNSRMSGSKVTANIYEIKKNLPVFVSTVKWNTASYKGAESAVMNHLAEIGKLPKKFADAYYRAADGKFRITGLS